MLVGKGNHAQFTSLSNPWIVGTPLLHIRDTFCTPNCMQTILDNPDLADSNLIFSVRTSTGAAGANNLTLDTRIALLLILLTSDYFITSNVMADCMVTFGHTCRAGTKILLHWSNSICTVDNVRGCMTVPEFYTSCVRLSLRFCSSNYFIPDLLCVEVWIC